MSSAVMRNDCRVSSQKLAIPFSSFLAMSVSVPLAGSMAFWASFTGFKFYFAKKAHLI